MCYAEEVLQPLEWITIWFIILYDFYNTIHRYAGILNMTNINYIELYPFAP